MLFMKVNVSFASLLAINFSFSVVINKSLVSGAFLDFKAKICCFNYDVWKIKVLNTFNLLLY